MKLPPQYRACTGAVLLMLYLLPVAAGASFVAFRGPDASSGPAVLASAFMDHAAGITAVKPRTDIRAAAELSCVALVCSFAGAVPPYGFVSAVPVPARVLSSSAFSSLFRPRAPPAFSV
jgi:hypothetical protein